MIYALLFEKLCKLRNVGDKSIGEVRDIFSELPLKNCPSHSPNFISMNGNSLPQLEVHFFLGCYRRFQNYAATKDKIAA